VFLHDENKEEKILSEANTRKTRIVCTIGPKTASVDRICDLLNAGMNVARMNFSHGDHAMHLNTIVNVREACARTKKLCALMLDTKGPEIRTGKLKGGVPVQLLAGQQLTIVTNAGPDFLGDSDKIAMDYGNLWRIVKPGSVIKIGDGLIVCHVVSTAENEVKVIVTNTAKIGQTKGVNLPGAVVDLPAITARDVEDLKFGVKNGVDFIAASFTRKASDVIEMRKVLGPQGENIKIISKIENQEGLDNFDEILAETDGVMVARGDLGVEIPIQKVCTAQKMMIRKCNLAGKPVITATQMLESMIVNPRPTRAEAADVSNAVFDGTDCVMLSGETANGDYPVEAVQIMSKICRKTELAIDYQAVFMSMMQMMKKPISRAEAITSSAVKASLDLLSPLIVCLTESGSSARFLAKYKPAVPVITLTALPQTARQCLVSRALYPVVVQRESESALVNLAFSLGLGLGWLKEKDKVVVVSGMKQGVSGTTNTLQILDVPKTSDPAPSALLKPPQEDAMNLDP